MSLDQTKRTIKSYFSVMDADEDFSMFYTGDVRWIMLESGQDVRGPSEVRDYILALHSKMFDHRQRRLVVADGHAYLEGDCVAQPGGTGRPRLVYCLVYDLDGDRIRDMRCYGSIAQLMTGTEAAQF
jgi:SnoaL-like domain